MSVQAVVTPELNGIATACPEALTDEELMRVLRGSEGFAVREDLFGELFRRYQTRVTAWCYRVTRNQNSAHDMAQDVFFKAYRNLDNFRGDSRISTWLYAIARNHCLTSLKKRACDPVDGSEAVPSRMRDYSVVEADLAIEKEQLYGRLREVMGSTLEPLEVQVMTLHYGHEMPLADITERLALTNPSGAKAYIVNARRKLSGVIRRRGLDAALLKHSPQPVVMVHRAAA